MQGLLRRLFSRGRERNYERLSFEEADNRYKEQFYSGRKKDRFEKEKDKYLFPYSNRYRDEKFIEIEFPVSCIKTRIRQEELIPEYSTRMKKGDDFPAVWLSLGRKLKNGDIVLEHDRRVRVMDGFHRITAAQSLGLETIKACMPESHYNAFNNMEVKEYELYYKD